jgi:DNA processing protein
LSEAVLVIEASVRSGSLITARMALEQGRDVLAVPGSVFAENSRGCHRLIREGAALIDSIETLLEELNVAAPASPESGEPAIKGPGALLLALSETTPQSAEDLAQCSGDSLQEVLLTLLELEDRGFVALMNGGYIRLPSA